MSREHSIYLVSTTGNPTRDEIQSVDRKVGECFLRPLGLDYCGHSIAPNLGKHAATWDVPAGKINEAIDFIETNTLEGYDIQLFVGCEKEVVAPSGTHLQPFKRRFA